MKKKKGKKKIDTNGKNRIGSPHDLYSAHSHFYNMVQHSGDDDVFKLI